MIRTALFATLVFFVISFASRPNAAVLYVAPPPLGDDSNPGTEAQPFGTIQKGIDAAAVSDTVIVAEGDYTENISFGGKNIVLRSSSPADWAVVRDTVIDGNEAGAAVTFAGTEGGVCVVSGFTIRNGKGIDGGGICGGIAADHSNATIRNNVIAGNSAQNGGGLAYCDGLIRNNLIYGNSATGDGGGVYKCDGVNESNLIVGNSAVYGGGGLDHCGGVIRNDTICDNSAGWCGGGVWSCGAAIVNCIMWGNTAFYGPQNHECFNLSYCCVQGGGGGTGGIADDPLFIDADGPDDDPETCEDNNYRLWVGSLCVDAGKNDDWMTGAVDLDGNQRILQGRVSLTVDMGAYEHVPSGPTAEKWYVDDSVSSSGDGKSWATAFKTIQEAIDSASDSGDTVTVAQGVYLETVNFNGKNIVLRSINPKDWEVVRQTVIDGNQAGAAVTFAGTENETCVLSGFTIGNGNGTDGGGICGWTETNSTRATIENNIIVGNSAQNGGGVAYCDGVIRNNLIYGNSATGDGGGVYKCDGVNESNLIVGNSAVYGGGGLDHCGGVIRNDTICDNSAGWCGGGVWSCGAAIVNCIMWGNTAFYGPQNHECFNLSYCCVQGGGGGTGGIADDPLFIDADGPDDDPETCEDNNYRLWVGSLCVDAGKNDDWMTGAVDLDGNQRILQGRVSLTVDMGAYEHVPSGPTAEKWYVDDSVSSSGDGKSWATAFKTIQEAIDSASDSGDTVTVAQGVYLETVNFNGKNIVLRSINPKDWEVVRQTVIDGNQAGAAVTFAGTENETCVLSGFTIGNGNGTDGGGICGWTETNSTRATIENNIIVGNSAQNGGGVAYCDGVIRNNFIYGNSATTNGGGVYKCDGVNESNLIAGNSAYNGAGLSYCNGVIRNDTICGNSAGWCGGGLWSCGAAIVNCIMWGNTAFYGPQNHESFNLSYCCVQGGGGGTGGIADDPHFADPDGADNNPETYEDNDYRLQADSPCVDRGLNEDWMWNAVDLDRSPRILPRTSDWTVDMGAYEYGLGKPAAVRRRPEGTLEVIWVSEPGTTYVVWSTLDLLSGEWNEEGTLSSVGSLTSWIVPDIASYRCKFYKVETR